MTIVPVFAPVYRATHCPLNDMIDLTLLSERSGMRALQRRDHALLCHDMFVRFRRQSNRLQASLVQSRRARGKVQAEHIGALGSVDAAVSVRSRLAFWATASAPG